MSKLNSTELNNPDSWEDIPFIDNLLKYRKQLLTGTLVTALLILGIFKYTSSRNQEAAIDYLNAEKFFTNFAAKGADAEASQSDLNQLQQILSRYPNLHAKYDGQLAQILIDRSQITEALPFAKLALERTHAENAPYYSKYSQTTLVIGEKKYEQALEQARMLQNELTAEKVADDEVLLAFNLLRIAMLQQQLGLKAEERATWLDLQQRSSKSKAFASQLEHLHEGKMTLSEYIAARITKI